MQGIQLGWRLEKVQGEVAVPLLLLFAPATAGCCPFSPFTSPLNRPPPHHTHTSHTLTHTTQPPLQPPSSSSCYCCPPLPLPLHLLQPPSSSSCYCCPPLPLLLHLPPHYPKPALPPSVQTPIINPSALARFVVRRHLAVLGLGGQRGRGQLERGQRVAAVGLDEVVKQAEEHDAGVPVATGLGLRALWG